MQAGLIDELDRKIIIELQVDGRLSCSALSEKIGVHKNTIHQRLNTLLKQKVIEIIAMPDPMKIGYRTIAYVGLTAQLGHVDYVASVVSSIHMVKAVTITAGRFDILATIYCRGDDDLSQFLLDEVRRIPELKTCETMVVLEIKKRTYAWLPFSLPDGSIPTIHTFKAGGLSSTERRIDSIDELLITQLQQQGRLSYRELGKRLSLSEAATRNRVKRLLGEGYIRITAMPNLSKIGRPMRVLVCLEVAPSHLDRVATDLAHKSYTQTVLLTSGRFNCMVLLFVKSPEELAHLLKRELAKIDNIGGSEILWLLERRKLDYTWIG